MPSGRYAGTVTDPSRDREGDPVERTRRSRVSFVSGRRPVDGRQLHQEVLDGRLLP